MLTGKRLLFQQVNFYVGTLLTRGDPSAAHHFIGMLLQLVLAVIMVHPSPIDTRFSSAVRDFRTFWFVSQPSLFCLHYRCRIELQALQELLREFVELNLPRLAESAKHSGTDKWELLISVISSAFGVSGPSTNVPKCIVPCALILIRIPPRILKGFAATPIL